MASRIASLALAMLLAIAAAPKSAWAQEFAAAAAGEPASQSEAAAKQQTDSSDQAPDAKTAASQGADTSSPTTGSEPPAAAGVDGQDQKANAAAQARQKKNTKKPVRTAAGKSPIQNIAEETLESLNSAVDIAQKSGSLASARSDKRLEDITARKDELRQKASVAKDDAAWTGVAAEAAATLADVLKLIEANGGSSADGGQPNGEQSTVNHSVSPQLGARDSLLRSSTLPLCVAGLSLVISVFSLGGGWLLARREINKALTEAGLL
jgi:hypothetical protein